MNPIGHEETGVGTTTAPKEVAAPPVDRKRVSVNDDRDYDLDKSDEVFVSMALAEETHDIKLR